MLKCYVQLIAIHSEKKKKKKKIIDSGFF